MAFGIRFTCSGRPHIGSYGNSVWLSHHPCSLALTQSLYLLDAPASDKSKCSKIGRQPREIPGHTQRLAKQIAIATVFSTFTIFVRICSKLRERKIVCVCCLLLYQFHFCSKCSSPVNDRVCKGICITPKEWRWLVFWSRRMCGVGSHQQTPLHVGQMQRILCGLSCVVINMAQSVTCAPQLLVD